MPLYGFSWIVLSLLGFWHDFFLGEHYGEDYKKPFIFCCYSGAIHINKNMNASFIAMNLKKIATWLKQKHWIIIKIISVKYNMNKWICKKKFILYCVKKNNQKQKNRKTLQHDNIYNNHITYILFVFLFSFFAFIIWSVITQNLTRDTFESRYNKAPPW